MPGEVVGSSFMISYLESRDSHMASRTAPRQHLILARILQVAELVDKEEGYLQKRWNYAIKESYLNDV